MADERTTALRAMATHQGFTLKASRRRKPGGDFGKFGLEDATGKPALGIGKTGLEASADAVEAFLRARTRDSWATSTKGLKRAKAPPPLPKPRAKAKPKFKPVVANLFAKLPAAKRTEVVTELFAKSSARIERIVSAGQATPDDAPMVQDHDAWVVVLAGEATLRIEDAAEVVLKLGDHVTIAAGQQHRVVRTSQDPPTVWLAVHIG
jgi:quercetin dioxygenase-like cupin family protein